MKRALKSEAIQETRVQSAATLHFIFGEENIRLLGTDLNKEAVSLAEILGKKILKSRNRKDRRITCTCA